MAGKPPSPSRFAGDYLYNSFQYMTTGIATEEFIGFRAARLYLVLHDDGFGAFTYTPFPNESNSIGYRNTSGNGLEIEWKWKDLGSIVQNAWYLSNFGMDTGSNIWVMEIYRRE